MIYSEAERKEIERVYGVFKDYIHASKFLDFVWSEKLGYLLLHIDPTKNTIEEDQIITSADELCAELFNEVATDVFQEAKREHFYPDADDDEIAEIPVAINALTGAQRGGVEHRLCDERVDHYDTHRCDTLKESAVLPTMWYRTRALLQQPGQWSALYPGSSVE